jgi:anti-sigma factor RsiW
MSHAHDLACIELVELVTDYLEGRLSADDTARFRQHLTACDGCTAYVEQMRTTIALTGSIAPDQIEPAARAALLEAFGSWAAR